MDFKNFKHVYVNEGKNTIIKSSFWKTYKDFTTQNPLLGNLQLQNKEAKIEENSRINITAQCKGSGAADSVKKRENFS